MDVAIDKIIVNSSPNEKIKDRNALCVQLGAMFGAILPNIISFIIFTDIYSRSIWNIFFLIGIIIIIPLPLITFLLKGDIDISEKNLDNSNKNVDSKAILIMCIFLFLLYSDKLFEYPLEPWILTKYGEENFSIFLLFLIVLIFINAIGTVMAGIISSKFDRKKILFSSICSTGILLLILPFTNMITFFIILGILQILAGFIVINIIAIMIEISQKKVIYYQIMSSSIILASVIFIPLGTYLTYLIPTEFIIITAGILTILSIIPIYFVDYNQQEKKK
jgi:hypothetical protein